MVDTGRFEHSNSPRRLPSAGSSLRRGKGMEDMRLPPASKLIRPASFHKTACFDKQLLEAFG